MADPLRERLAKPVIELRGLLQDALAKRLHGEFGIDAATGERRPERDLALDAPGLDARARLLAVLDHFEEQGLDPARAVHRLLHEAAFTHLNRLVALKMLEDESRRVLPRAITGGRDAAAFRMFRGVAEEHVAAHSSDEGFLLFLDLLYDELAAEVGELFDAADPRAILGPDIDTLRAAAARLDAPDLTDVWSKDETLGWVYQLFTTAEMRKASRAEHKKGPPDAEHLAFRNQFYTPRWVVEFLVDNTLGRIWCEMHPESRQREQRELLVVQPDEKLPERPVRDPASFRILDPACGSGHFLLYCFDVLAELYEEAGTPRAEIAAQIVGQNLWGIEIDLRAAQIAALALYLRAKRFDRSTSVPPANIVLAEAMPKESPMWDEIRARATQPTDGPVRDVIEGMRREFADADLIGALYPMRRLAEGWLKGHKSKKKKGELALALYDWSAAEGRVRELLGEFRGRAGVDPRRRLFAREQGHDLAVVAALLQRYDVVLMNPPFGQPVPSTNERLKRWYPCAGDRTNLYAAFVEQGLTLLRDGGLLGAITDRSGFFITTFQAFRTEVVLGMAEVCVFADLGYRILGGAEEPAAVEAAAYALRRTLAET